MNYAAVPAVCECQKNRVIAIQQPRFHFVTQWGFFTWVGFIIMTLLFNLFWIGAVLGWHHKDILSPKKVCNKCGKPIPPENLRLQ